MGALTTQETETPQAVAAPGDTTAEETPVIAFGPVLPSIGSWEWVGADGDNRRRPGGTGELMTGSLPTIDPQHSHEQAARTGYDTARSATLAGDAGAARGLYAALITDATPPVWRGLALNDLGTLAALPPLAVDPVHGPGRLDLRMSAPQPRTGCGRQVTTR
jgi:hypothetical protein